MSEQSRKNLSRVSGIKNHISHLIEGSLYMGLPLHGLELLRRGLDRHPEHVPSDDLALQAAGLHQVLQDLDREVLGLLHLLNREADGDC